MHTCSKIAIQEILARRQNMNGHSDYIVHTSESVGSTDDPFDAVGSFHADIGVAVGYSRSNDVLLHVS